MVMVRLRRSGSAPAPGVLVGPVRFVRQDADFDSLRGGDIVLVHMPDLGARHARGLIDSGVRAVLNTAPSAGGRVPNRGPSQLSSAGVPLIDIADEAIWTLLRNGDVIHLSDGNVLRDGVLVVAGVPIDSAHSSEMLAEAESGLATRLDTLAANATDHIQREQAMLLDGARVPHVRTSMHRRPVIVVSDGYDADVDLADLKGFIGNNDPVLIGAGAGADVLFKAGYTPHVVVGAMENLTDRMLRSSGEVVVTTASGRVSTPERLERHGKEIVTFVSAGSDDDLAILLADTNQAAVIVHVGAPPTLAEFLEGPPSEVARMFVARLRAGSKLVDAKSVNHLTTHTMSWWPLVFLMLAGLVAVAVAITVTPIGQDWIDRLTDSISGLGTWMIGPWTKGQNL
jgi:uncharacterized membrane-anchored protein